MGLNVLVLGASGATGRLAVEACRAMGHTVTAFVRSDVEYPGVRVVRGDATNARDVDRAMVGQDAVVVVLGIRENPLAVRFRGSRGTPLDVRSVGTRNVVAAMRTHGVRRLVVQTTYGVGETWNQLSMGWKAMFSLILAPQIADTELQEEVVRDSGLDWVLVRPVGLNDDTAERPILASPDGETRSMSVPRRAVARVLADAILDPGLVGRSVAVSAGV